MSKSCSSVDLVLTVICLSVTMSIEAEAQSTTDETEGNTRLNSSRLCELEPSKRAFVSALINNCFPLLIQQNANNGSPLFNNSWAEYKLGFNDSSGNYWLGNDLLSQLTMTGRYKLRVDLQSRNYPRNWYYAEYSTFIVGLESSNYRLTVSGYSGNTQFNSFLYHDRAVFSTFDRDNDRSMSENCAARYGGGFWYTTCYFCCMNCYHDSFYWSGLPGGRRLWSTRMWLLCK